DDREARPRRVGTQPAHADSRREHSSRAAPRSPSDPEPAMKRKTLIVSSAAALAVLAAVGLAAMAKTTAAPAPVAQGTPLPSVTMAEVKPVTSAPKEEITGALNPAKELKVGFEVGGRLARVVAKKGALVAEGEMIAQLDPELADAQVQQAEAALNAAEAQS